MRADYTRVASLRPRVAKKSRWRGQTITSRIALACDAALGIRAASVVTDKENADRENKTAYAYQIAMSPISWQIRAFMRLTAALEW